MPRSPPEDYVPGRGLLEEGKNELNDNYDCHNIYLLAISTRITV